MPEYEVTVFWKNGGWDMRRPRRRNAATARAAAEAVVDQPLTADGGPGRLRATVWKVGDPPVRHRPFYESD